LGSSTQGAQGFGAICSRPLPVGSPLGLSKFTGKVLIGILRNDSDVAAGIWA
jgi:hypothetical protein